MDRPSFEQLIKEDRAARESKVWRGPFLEYLDLVREDPSLPKLSHAPVPTGPGRPGEERAGRTSPAGPPGRRALLRDRELPDGRGAPPSHSAPSAEGVREDARRAHRGRPLPGVPLPPEGGVRRPLRGGAGEHALLLE